MDHSNISLIRYVSFGSKYPYVIDDTLQVKSVVLHTLNRARFNVAVESFLKTGIDGCNMPFLCNVLTLSCNVFFILNVSLRDKDLHN